ncbi:MAG TPA: GxxExxY protein [Saprospiraceae bacterium]|nr:GxxExxY protein [Saprospiraceae bacterium]
MKHQELTSRIIGICIKVHAELGPGLLESVYEEAICYELTKNNIEFKRQQAFRVKYDDKNMGKGFRADIIVENKVVVDVKSKDMIAPVDSKILLTYLRFTGIEVGLLVNFKVALLKDGITRLILDRKPSLP